MPLTSFFFKRKAGKSDEQIANDMAWALENAIREGAEKDIPEGSRYITLSDTLAKKLARFLRGIK